MFGKLLMLFIIVPIAELYLLVAVGEKIGTLNTIAIVVITGFVGASFAKIQGALVLRKIQSTWGRGEIPGEDLMQGALILAGGIMLITPGIITDVVGLSLIFPLTRIFYAKLVMAWFKKKMQSGVINVTGTGGSFDQDMPFNPLRDSDDAGSDCFEEGEIIDLGPESKE